MNTFSFLIAFSAVVCGAFANPGNYYGGNSASWNNNGHASVRAWEEPAPCEGSSGARVQVSTSSDYSNALNNAGYSGYAGSYSGSYGSDIATSINNGAPCPPARTTYQQHPGFNQQNERGEIIIHRPAPIIVKRPPTKVLVNHPPLVVKPAPVVLHRPPPMVVKPVLVRHHPQPVKVEPVYVKVMKPATSEKYLLEDRNNAGCADDGASYNNYGHNAAISAVDTGCH